MKKDSKIVITGAAGLLGQNTILRLKEEGYQNIVAMDCHPDNLEILKSLNPEITIINADLAGDGDWKKQLDGADVLLQMHAQITSLEYQPYERNNITATHHVMEAAKQYRIPYVVHISSSVVVSVADDYYTNTKKAQDEIVRQSGVPFCALRPTLMFGWFDKKHLGWLSRFMKKTPVFPIPSDGKFLRQPLYARDMASVVIKAMEQQPKGKEYNIIGQEDIDYIDIIRRIKKVCGLKTMIIKLPYGFFKFLMKGYAFFFGKAPFTADQLDALSAGDYFSSDPWWDIFGVTPTPFNQALEETFLNETYSKIILKP